jgi:hypothetical protein
MEGSYRPSREYGESADPGAHRRPPAREAPGSRRPPPGAREYEPPHDEYAEEWHAEHERGAPRLRTTPVAVWLALVLGIAIAVALFANAGANNYQGCVEAVTAKYGGATDSLTRLGRNDALSHCSHSPF